MSKIAILGSGALGTALAINFSKNQNIEKILIYSRKSEIQSVIQNDKRCFFEDIILSDKISCTLEIENVEKCEIIFITVNSLGFTDIIDKLSKLHFKKQPLIVICTKSIGKNGEFLHEIAMQKLNNNNVALLYGPSFAHEIAYGEMTCVNFIHNDKNANYIDLLVDSNTNLRMILICDYIGAQICSVMKNICAIYMGIMNGAGMKNDFLAVVFKFFVDEIAKTIEIHGGNRETIFSLCGIGDLFLTCTSFDSRNYSFGYAIGFEKNITNVLIKYQNNYPEGYLSLNNLLILNKSKGFDSILCEKLSLFLKNDENFNVDLLKNIF